MPIIDKEGWDKAVEKNPDPYGGAIVKVAGRVMAILDEEPGDFDCHTLIVRADKETGHYGLSGFQAEAIESTVYVFHSRGEEFRRKWDEWNQVKVAP